MKHLTIFFLAITISFVSCSRMSEDDAFQKAKTALDQKKTDDAIKYLEIITKEYPSGKYAHQALFYLASIYQNDKKDIQKAMDLYRDVVKKYPQSESAPKALFTQAFVYANQLHNTGKARELYRQFISTYPNHEMAKSARAELDNIGVDPHVLLESLQQKQVADAPDQKTK